MQARLFSAKINSTKTQLESAVEWHSTFLSESLKQQITKVHVASFLDLYQDFSETELALKAGLTKKTWLTRMIEDELKDVEAGKIQLATVSVEGRVAGFVTCASHFGQERRKELNKEHARIEKQLDTIEKGYRNEDPTVTSREYRQLAAKQLEVSAKLDFFNDRLSNFKSDVYVSLLAVNPFRISQEKIRLGLGTDLMKSVEARFTDANCIVLDTRRINEAGRAFYKSIGYDESSTFSSVNALKYVGCEKEVDRRQAFV